MFTNDQRQDPKISTNIHFLGQCMDHMALWLYYFIALHGYLLPNNVVGQNKATFLDLIIMERTEQLNS